MELVSSFANLRGHDIGVTALDAGRAGLADYALVRRAARGLGRAAADGEHYCHAAPGVNTTLAMMKDRFRGQLGNVELVRRLMATAGDRLHADDDPAHEGATSARYGVGVVDPAAVPDPVGALATGAAGNGAPIAATQLVAPSAYGDALARVAGVEIAAFDVRNASFWTPAGPAGRGRPGSGGSGAALRGWRRRAGWMSRAGGSRPGLGLPASEPRGECASSRRTRRGGAPARSWSWEQPRECGTTWERINTLIGDQKDLVTRLGH